MNQEDSMEDQRTWIISMQRGVSFIIVILIVLFDTSLLERID